MKPGGSERFEVWNDKPASQHREVTSLLSKFYR